MREERKQKALEIHKKLERYGVSVAIRIIAVVIGLLCALYITTDNVPMIFIIWVAVAMFANYLIALAVSFAVARCVIDEVGK